MRQPTIILVCVFAILALAASCVNPGVMNTPPVKDPQPKPTSTPPATPKPTSTPAPIPPAPSPLSTTVLSWETKEEVQRKVWSLALVEYVANRKVQFEEAKDLTTFCPKYSKLIKQQQVSAISELLIAVMYYESGYNPTSRMKEGPLGTDCVTGLPVYSEGLLQLSYCDKTWAKFCRFNWEADKRLDPTSPKKTILDPIINMECGVGILANQISKKKAVAFDSGNYWSTLKPNGKYGKVPQIKERMKKNAAYCY